MKFLVVYYSYQGNTKSIVDMINKKITWNTGRNLEGVVDSNNKYSYTYDETGIRTPKTALFFRKLTEQYTNIKPMHIYEAKYESININTIPLCNY